MKKKGKSPVLYPELWVSELWAQVLGSGFATWVI